MFRLVLVVVAIFLMPALLQTGGAWAGDDQSSLNSRDDMRGMFVLKLPFGGAEVFSAPRVGFDFQMQRRSDLDYLRESHDPETGERLPEVDTSGVRTWSLEEPEFTLPDELQGESEKEEPRSEHLHSG